VLLTLALLALLVVAAAPARATTATLDSLDVLQVKDELVAIRDGNIPASIRLERAEQILWQGATGIVGVALTNRRFLAVSTRSAGWKQVGLQRGEGRSANVELGANVALVLTGTRILAFDGASGRLTERHLSPHEALLTSGVNEHVAIAVTTRRVIGLASHFGAPTEIPLHVSESYRSSKVLGMSARVQTSHRILVCHGSSGTWTEEALPLR
jgi:hypothetical protein